MTIRRIAASLWFAVVLLLACVASEQKVGTPPPPVRVDTAPTETIDPNASVQPNVHPISPEEWAASDIDLDTLEPATAAADTTQPLRKAPMHIVHFVAPAQSAPSVRSCIGYPLTAGCNRVRYNLLLQPNLYDVTIRNWSDPQWRATFRVDGGTFPVNLWRIRGGVPTFWKQVRVQAGPGLPTGNPQTALSADFFRGGDDLCVGAVRNIGPLLVAYDQQTGLVVQPQLSQIQTSSNDSTP